MEWKKEKISASELEKRQKEYMNEALAMMKRGVTVSVTVQTPAPVSEEEQAVHAEGNSEQADAVQQEASAQMEETHEEAVAEKVDVQQEEPEQTSELPQDDEEEQCEEDEPEKDDDKYGVYTADELMNSEHGSEGLKKAAEILEEMTRNTEMMKKFADGDEEDDSGTTDFPDFSCGMPDEGERFRENEEEHAKEKLVPEDE